MVNFQIELRGMAFFKAKNVYSGDHDGMMYSIKLSEEGFVACVWPGPWCREKTPEEQQCSETFPSNEEGLCAAGEWLVQQYESKPGQWHTHVGFPT